ncbi:MAG: hypothetical protein FWD39_06965, partial [Clostridiales bacterium]|nr:hypothetical protein [Clostridiales bacterium]
LVFAGENNQKITLYADNTFVANFADNVTVIGYYGLRNPGTNATTGAPTAGSITFVAGSPTFNASGVLSGATAVASLQIVDGVLTLELPALWTEISGGKAFKLQ